MSLAQVRAGLYGLVGTGFSPLRGDFRRSRRKAYLGAKQAAEKPNVFEGYDLQVVRKVLQTGAALAAEGTTLGPSTIFPQP